MKNLIFISIISIIVFFVSCSDDDNNSNNNDDGKNNNNDIILDSNAIMNLKIGNIWKYNRYDTLNNGEAYTVEFETVVKTIQGDGNESYFVIYLGEHGYDEQYVIKNDGIYKYHEGMRALFMFVKYPCNKGDYFLNLMADTVTVLSTDTLVTVGDKTYNTIHYQIKEIYEGTPIYRDYYFKLRLGIVKEEQYILDENNNKVNPTLYELVEFVQGNG